MKQARIDRDGRPRGRWRRLWTGLAALGLLGAAQQAHAGVRLERDALQSRVESMRAALHDAARGGPAGRWLTAQWNNFKNWNNWNNWKKWLNN